MTGNLCEGSQTLYTQRSTINWVVGLISALYDRQPLKREPYTQRFTSVCVQRLCIVILLNFDSLNNHYTHLTVYCFPLTDIVLPKLPLTYVVGCPYVRFCIRAKYQGRRSTNYILLTLKHQINCDPLVDVKIA